MTSRSRPGVDVPWVTRWSGEPMIGARVSLALGGRLALEHVDAPGSGRPIYSENHLGRQRASALQGLCPMCGEPTDEADGWSLTAESLDAGTLRSRGLGGLIPAGIGDTTPVIDAGSIGPLHRDCAQRSSRECPHLRTAGRDAIRFPVRRILTPLWVEPLVDRGDAVLAHPRPRPRAIGFIQILGLPAG